MELISQHAKRIMEGCKERAREMGLSFQDESLEYIVTNRDLLELSPKNMIPTLYDYWVQDVEVLKEKGRYELYPGNPYETVINTRPAISFYNDNNPDWLNVMIFYHVIGHIDFFQNNLYFRHTWDYDFVSRALSDKRMIAKLRSEKGRWVDYVIEFARAIDNLVGYHGELARFSGPVKGRKLNRLDYYFDIFLQGDSKVPVAAYVKEIERYNAMVRENPNEAEDRFIEGIQVKYAEFESLYNKYLKDTKLRGRLDLFQFLMDKSDFLNKEKNRWMLMILEAVRTTSLYFQPQIRTKILNEGWASYWHEELFLNDDRINGHEVDFAVVNAKVCAMPRVGLNPYALGMRLFSYIEDLGNKGKISRAFRYLKDKELRDAFDDKTQGGRDLIFHVRENCSDSMFINSFIDQDFIDLHKLFVTGKRLHKERMTWQYYVKSRDAEQYKQMVLDSLYHPPSIEISVLEDNSLLLNHVFEGKPLVQEYIKGTLLGIEYLWGNQVYLDTHETQLQKTPSAAEGQATKEKAADQISWRRVRYRMKERVLSRKDLG
ncbi:MAG: SpoVR family protein [Desulfopila sp.]|jgi:stage V sporulation protein R|nr:SpoVR family protein [Desulfopila sp.]